MALNLHRGTGPIGPPREVRVIEIPDRALSRRDGFRRRVETRTPRRSAPEFLVQAGSLGVLGLLGADCVGADSSPGYNRAILIRRMRR